MTDYTGRVLNQKSGVWTPGTMQAIGIGLECRFLYNGLWINNLSAMERFELTEIAGFEDADIRASAQQNPTDDGETPLPAFYGGRSMTMTGKVVCGSIPRLRDMRDALVAAFGSLVEQQMTIRKPWNTGLDLWINCRKQDKLSLPDKQPDGSYKRDFQILLRAGNPVFRGAVQHSQTMHPSIINVFGRVYDRTYDLVYATPLDPSFSPVTVGGGANQMVLTNAGNYWSKPVIRFTGALGPLTFTNLTTGVAVTLTQSVAAGDYVEWDIPGRTFKDSLANDRWDMLDFSSDRPLLGGSGQVTGGLNTYGLSVSSFDSNGAVTVSWYDTSL